MVGLAPDIVLAGGTEDASKTAGCASADESLDDGAEEAAEVGVEADGAAASAEE